MNALALIFVCALLHTGCLEGASGHQETVTMNQMKKVKEGLFKDYDKSIRPLLGGANTTEVGFAIILRQIIDVDEEQSLLTLDSYWVITWVDPRLSWNKTDYDGYFQLPSDVMWKPDLSVYNSHGAIVDPTHEVLTYVYNTGHVTWVPPAVTTTYCSTKDVLYPSETVTCNVDIGSWSHDGWEVNITFYHGEITLEDFQNDNARWELLTEQVTAHRNQTYYECCEEPYVKVVISLPLKRRPVPELVAVRPPCVLITALALALLWMPPGDAGKRLYIGCLLFLVLNVLTVYVAAKTRSPQAVYSAVSLLRSTMYALSSLLILQVVTLRLTRMNGPLRPHPSLVALLSGPLSKYACLGSTSEKSGDRVRLSDDVEALEPAPGPREEWLLVATAMDRVLFVVYALAMSFIHLA